MSRGGRGGKFQAGRPRGPALPFEIDPELLAAVDKAEDERRGSKEDFSKELYPDLPDYIAAAPITAPERRAVQLERHIWARRRASPFWTGERWMEKAVHDDGFSSVETYSRKRKRKPFRMANLKQVKVCYQQCFPKELLDVVISPDVTQPQQKKKVNGLSKTAVEKLAKVVEEDKSPVEEISPTTEEVKVIDSDFDDDEENDDVDLDAEVKDDTFEDDDDNDYNAEKYFDGGESDYDSGAGEGDGGGDGDDGF